MVGGIKVTQLAVTAAVLSMLGAADAPAIRTAIGLGDIATHAVSEFATAAQGTTANAALSRGGGTMTGNIAMGTHDISGGGTATFTTFAGALTGNADSATTVANSAITDAKLSLTTPALGTPSALVGTNISGTAASLTAGHVTTNANLTGDVTSSGNATTIANAVVTNAKMANMAGSSIKCNTSGSAGVGGDCTAGNVQTLLGLDSAAYAPVATFATAVQGSTADAALSRGGGTMTGNIAMGGANISGGGTATFTTFSGALTGNADSATTVANSAITDAKLSLTTPALGAPTLTGKITNYNSIATVEGGVPSLVKFGSQTALTANLGATTIYTSAPAGRYRISVVGTITTFGGTATIPRINVIFTHGTVVKTIMVAQSLASFSTANGTVGSGLINVDASTNIQYSTGGTGGDYASTGTPMQYDLYIVLEAI